MSGLGYELRKIPPVTRFLCISSLAVTLAVLLEFVSVSNVVFNRDLVGKKFQVWRVYTSFFLGRLDLMYIFDFAMLYLNSDGLESADFPARSQDYAWGLSIASIAIMILNLPLRSGTHFRALLHCITYLRCMLAPPGHQTSIWGLFNILTVYFPLFLLLVELLIYGKQGLTRAVTGVLVGHMWFWGVFQSRALWDAARAPAWVSKFVARGPVPSLGAGSGVHVIPPREKPQGQRGPTSWTGGHKWGSGQKLGSE